MITRANCVVLVLASLGACGTDRPSPRSPLDPEHNADETSAQATPKDDPSSTPVPTLESTAAKPACTPSEQSICGPFSSELISLCLKFSTQDEHGTIACHGPRWSKAFHTNLAAKLGATEKKTEKGGDDFERVIVHILKWEGECSDHPQDRGGRTFKGITTERARTNGWKADVCTLSHATVLAIYRNDYWEPRARLHAWPLNLAVMNTEVNSGGGRAQKVLDRMKSENIGGGLVTQAKWFVDQQTSFYKSIVANNKSQNVFLKWWLNRSKHMQEVISGTSSLSLYAESDSDGSWTAKALQD